MWELIAHKDARQFSEHLNALTGDQYNEWGQNTIPPLTTHKRPEYSDELLVLVRQCLNLRPSLRPTAGQILEVTGSALSKFEEQLGRADTGIETHSQKDSDNYQLPKRYFKENEISSMPLGPHLPDFGINDQCVADFALKRTVMQGPSGDLSSIHDVRLGNGALCSLCNLSSKTPERSTGREDGNRALNRAGRPEMQQHEQPLHSRHQHRPEPVLTPDISLLGLGWNNDQRREPERRIEEQR